METICLSEEEENEEGNDCLGFHHMHTFLLPHFSLPSVGDHAHIACCCIIITDGKQPRKAVKRYGGEFTHLQSREQWPPAALSPPSEEEREPIKVLTSSRFNPAHSGWARLGGRGSHVVLQFCSTDGVAVHPPLAVQPSFPLSSAAARGLPAHPASHTLQLDRSCTAV